MSKMTLEWVRDELRDDEFSADDPDTKRYYRGLADTIDAEIRRTGSVS